MNRRLFPTGLLLLTVLLAGAALYWNGNYVVYLLTYIFSFVFLLCRAVFSPFSPLEKLAQILLYALLLAAQILFAVLVLRPAAGQWQLFTLCRLLGVLIVLVPFLIRQLRCGPPEP